MYKEYQYQETLNLSMNNYYENKIPEELTNTLCNITSDKNFDWYYNKSTLGSNFISSVSNIEDSCQLVHVFFNKFRTINQDPFAEKALMLLPYIQKSLNIEIKSINRIKGNLLFNKTDWTKEKYHPPHYDEITDNFISVIYYVHDSDGDTILFDKSYPEELLNLKEITRFTPKSGAFSVFKSNQYHSSCNPILFDKRTIINYVLEI